MKSAGTDTTIGVTDPTTPAVDAPPRTELGRGAKIGRYEIIRMIGRGGMGAVYAAYDPQLDRQIALKLLHASGRLAPESLINEAKALARLDDPHVVQVFDAGVHDDEVFIAMKLVSGEDLSTALAKRHPKPNQIIAWFVDAGRGLAAAHAAGLIHRDFKASNVLIDAKGRVAVTDFGLAVNTTDSAQGFAGTPAYMAPEQHELQPATEASDQFAFCVALWEALFGAHPYLVRSEESISAAMIGHAIIAEPLIPPAKRVNAPRRLVEILTRGLARAPSQRWPNMTALLAQLAPIQKRRVWPIVAVVVVAAVASGAGVWVYSSHTACNAPARLARIWSPQHATTLHQHFAATGVSFANTVADRVTSELDHYTARWLDLSIGACSADHSELLVRQRACLDQRLDGVHAAVDVLDAISGDAISHAQDLTAGLPELADCADRAALLAGPGAPPPEIAAQVRSLDADLSKLEATERTAQLIPLASVRALVTRADELRWGPLSARAHIALGLSLGQHYQPAIDELINGAELAIANHLDTDAMIAWRSALAEAAYEHKPDAIAMIVAQGRSAAARINRPSVSLGLEIAYARALTQSEQWETALPLCRKAIVAAEQLPSDSQKALLVDDAHDCLFEALMPAGKMDELRTVAAERIATTTKRFGPDAPPLATFEDQLAESFAMQGDVKSARDYIDRAGAVVAKAFPDGKGYIAAQYIHTRGEVEMAEGNLPAAVKTFRAALAIAQAVQPKQVVMLAQIQTGLALALAQSNDLPGAQRAFEDAIATMRAQDPQSVGLAMLLLNASQVADFEAGLRDLEEANKILEGKHDPRANYAVQAQAVIEAQHHRWPQALAHAETAVAFAKTDPNGSPANTAELELTLAEALRATHGDLKRAKAIATDARKIAMQLGPAGAELVKRADHFLAH